MIDKKTKKIIFICGAILLISICIFEFVSFKNKSDVIKTSQGKSEYLFSLRNNYIGDSSADSKIIKALEIEKFGSCKVELKTYEKPYILTINLDIIKNENEREKINLKSYGLILLALIENADEVHWNVKTDGVQENLFIVTVYDANKEYGNIKDYGKSSEKLNELLIKTGYYKQGER